MTRFAPAINISSSLFEIEDRFLAAMQEAFHRFHSLELPGFRMGWIIEMRDKLWRGLTLLLILWGAVRLAMTDFGVAGLLSLNAPKYQSANCANP
jgi:hypothetical protein